LLSKGVINWPAGEDAGSNSSGQNRKRIYREKCEEFFAKLGPEEQIEELEYLEQRLHQIKKIKRI